MTEARAAYKRAGVDVDAGEWAVELMRASIEGTKRGYALGGLANRGRDPLGEVRPGLRLCVIGLWQPLDLIDVEHRIGL